MDVISWELVQRRGLNEREVRRLVSSGEWLHLSRGWYATRPARDAHDFHRLRLEALLADYSGRAVASHTSAALRLDLPVHRLDLTRVHLARLGPGKPRRTANLQLHRDHDRAFAPRGDTEHPATVVIQLARLDLLAGLAAADHVLRCRLADQDALSAAATRCVGLDGAAAARQVASRADARHESVGETLLAHQLWQAGIAFTPQFAVPGTQRWTPSGQGYRADFVVDRERVLIEFDGKVKYSDPDALFKEKRREDNLRSLGWTVVRIVWADLQVEGRAAELVRAAVRRTRAA